MPRELADVRGARLSSSPPPRTAQPRSATIQRRVPADGVTMVAGLRLRIGRTHAKKIVTIVVEETYFRVSHDGEELALHPRDRTGPSGSPPTAVATADPRPRCPENRPSTISQDVTHHGHRPRGDLLQIEADHRRHAVVEQSIAELKSAGLAHLPSGRIMADAA